MRIAVAIVLTPEERKQLVDWSRGRSLPKRIVERARIVLAAAEGQQNKQIAEELGLDPHTIALWRNRFALLRIPGIQKDAPRPGRNPHVTLEAAKAVVVKTLRTKPRGRTHWSTRVMAREVGLDHVTVHRIWKRYGLQPHETQSFKLSKDPRFVEKLVDVVGIYQNPPDRSVVLSVDEKPQTQALERTQAILPMGKDWPEGRPHDYRRHGTVDLFAALNILDGQVVTEFHARHRQKEFVAFLDTLDHTVPPGLQVHVVLDNLSVHKAPRVQGWLRRHPRFHFHFTPTGSSWVNMVEGWLGQLEQYALSRGSFKSVPELKQAILDFTESSNSVAKPWTWTKDAQEIVRKIGKLRRRIFGPIIDPVTGEIMGYPLETPH
jgi:transposase